ncbi:MAG: S41 family peptidase [Acidiferrobacterales bacterium]|nr:S41 family peptidase [Acidiferrobacterales bacterium]
MLKNILVVSLSLLMLGGCKQKGKAFIEEQYWGTWQSSGYGYILDINQGEFELYDIDASFCVKQAASSDEIAQQLNYFQTVSKNKISLGESAKSKRYYFTRINNLPQRCQESIDNTPEIVLEQFSTIMDEHYAFFDLYGVKWQQRVDAAKAKVDGNTTDQELLNVLSDMLKGMTDAHLYINATVNGESEHIGYGDSKVLNPALDHAFAQQNTIKSRKEFGRHWYKDTLSKIDDLLSSETKYAANNQIIWGSVNNIGYIKLRNMVGFIDEGSITDEVEAVNEAMTEILAQLANKSSIVIDLTTNSGGSDEIGRAVVNHFTDKKLKLYSHSTQGSPETPQTFYSEPRENAFLGKVVLYTSDHSVSAAETFTIAMKALPNVTHVGTTTRGALSDILDKTLINGWDVGLSNMRYLDANGKLWEAIGLLPDIELNVFSDEDIFNSHKKSTQKLFAMIEAGKI